MTPFFIFVAQSSVTALPMVSAPAPQTPSSSWITTADYPRDALRNSTAGAASASITVAPDGKIIRCEIEKSSGSASLDIATCDLLVRRGSYAGARDGSGQASYGVDRGTVRWVLPGQTLPSSRSIQMSVQIEKMPKGLSDPAFVRIDAFVDAAGKLTACNMGRQDNKYDPMPIDIARASRALSDSACSVATKELTAIPAKDANGNLVGSVQSIMVGFTTNLKP